VDEAVQRQARRIRSSSYVSIGHSCEGIIMISAGYVEHGI
jgi:hypothetical protein